MARGLEYPQTLPSLPGRLGIGLHIAGSSATIMLAYPFHSHNIFLIILRKHDIVFFSFTCHYKRHAIAVCRLKLWLCPPQVSSIKPLIKF